MFSVYVEKWHEVKAWGLFREGQDIILDLGKYRVFVSRKY